jgi:hypothetical protein
MAQYKALKGLNYPNGKGGEKRVEIGEDCSDMPKTDIKDAIEGGDIEEVKVNKKSAEPPAET